MTFPEGDPRHCELCRKRASGELEPSKPIILPQRRPYPVPTPEQIDAYIRSWRKP